MSGRRLSNRPQERPGPAQTRQNHDGAELESLVAAVAERRRLAVLASAQIGGLAGIGGERLRHKAAALV